MLTNRKYSELIKESIILQEMIPWRSSEVKLQMGKTAMDGLKQDCLILNDLKFIATFKPSFMFIVPKISLLQKVNSGTNGYIITARKAQQLEYSVSSKGSCDAYTYFFGRPKAGRSFDWYQRIFERGFSLENIKGLQGFPDDIKIEVTASKKDYTRTDFFTGSQSPGKGETNDDSMLKIPARFSTTMS